MKVFCTGGMIAAKGDDAMDFGDSGPNLRRIEGSKDRRIKVWS